MCKEIKRLKALSECTHISPIDKKAISWLLRQVESPKVEEGLGFDGWNLSIGRQYQIKQYLKN